MFNELEEKVNKLEGIISCSITGETAIDEIHIIANKERKPKRIVRDIETMVLVNLDQEVSHKKISIAQIDTQDQTITQDEIELISIHRENNQPICHFKLEINNNLIEKEIGGEEGVPLSFMVAKGMLKIINDYLNLEGKLRVENLFTTGINEEVIVAQIILYKTGDFGGQKRLVGAAYIDNHLALATGKACLKALNQFLKIK
ncbi:hypothetical protein [Halanaerobaculum tunisiense]